MIEFLRNSGAVLQDFLQDKKKKTTKTDEKPKKQTWLGRFINGSFATFRFLCAIPQKCTQK